MDPYYEDRVLSIVRGREGCRDQYHYSRSQFQQQLNETALVHRKSKGGWVFWRADERQQHQHQIITLLKYISSKCDLFEHYIVQFWGVMKVEGRNHYLSTLSYPFSVSSLNQGSCGYRKLCRDHVYVVDVGDDDDQEQVGLGAVGRAYRKKHPESTPDLRLYSADEFPMRDEAARCGFRAYMALPLFDSYTNTGQCFGVLEFLSYSFTERTGLFSTWDGEALQISGLRSTHNSISTSHFIQEKQKPESEIRKILELAMKTVPQLYLAQVWVPCKQCRVNMNSTNLFCMEISSFISSQNRTVDSWLGIDEDMHDYIQACEFQNLQIDRRSSLSNLCDVSISKNPLVHYARRARMSHCLAVSLQSLYVTNHLYVIQFFLQPKPNLREVGCSDYALHLLLRIIEMNLKRFKFISGRHTIEGMLLQSGQHSLTECETIDHLNVMNSYNFNEDFSESEFNTYLETVYYSFKGNFEGWVYCCSSICENYAKSNLMEKIENLMKNITDSYWTQEYWIVQFWAPKMVEGRCCLGTLDQPFALGCLTKELASFRKKCMAHYYFVGDEAKQEELGPPGRVFKTGHPEFTPDLFCYTTKEFPIRNYAMQSSSPRYFSLPIFDEHNHECVGVLEFVGFIYSDHILIGRALEVAKLCSTHVDFYPGFLANEEAFNTIHCRTKALTEVQNALKLISDNIPQLHMANVWVPNGECVTSIYSNTRCMELALSTKDSGTFMPTSEVHWIHVQSGKGMVGMVLASENKSCFCPYLCEFSIADQPLSQFEKRDRRDVCFAICLQSSHTEDLVYVVEFFLYQGPKTYEYVRSFLNFLLPIMKHELKSFKMASGKQLGEELVVEVIEFSDANRIVSSESEAVADVFPIKFQSVQYSQKENQHIEEQQREECSNAAAAAASDSERKKRGKRKTQEYSVVASDSKMGAQGKSKPRHHLTLEDLQPLFHVEKLTDVRKMLNVSKATLYRAREKYGLLDWPGKLQKNPLPEESQQDSQPSTSSNNIQSLDTNAQSTHHVNNAEAEAEAEKVIIKATYGEDTIRFQVCLPLEFAKLIKEVSKKLNLEKGAFKLIYLDEDGADILLTDDDDLELCRKSQITSIHKTFIQLFVR